MKKVRFGIVGLGTIGKVHAQNILDGKVKDGVLTAVCDIAPANINYDEVKSFNSISDMFKSGEVDAVLIATPHYYRPDLAMEAFNHNLHVMLEKPAGVYLSHVREMVSAAKAAEAEAGCVFGIMFQYRTDGAFKKMHQLVHDGEIGEIKRTNWVATHNYREQEYYDRNNWRGTWKGAGGGVLLNQCSHNLDIMQWVCGMPTKVTAFCHEGKWHDIEVEDDVTAYIEYANGATGSFVASTGDKAGTNRFEVVGSLGKIVYEDGKLSIFKEPEYKKVAVRTGGKPADRARVLASFVDKVLNRGELCVEGEEGINSLVLSNAMYLSSWLGKTVPVPLDEELFLEELRRKYSKAAF